MHIAIVSPEVAGVCTGNRVTARRWAQLLRQSGHRVRVVAPAARARADVLVGLHAGHSAPAVLRFASDYPDRPIVVALGGTDLYRHIHRSQRARRALQLARRLIVLQPCAVQELPSEYREKCRVILQSAVPLRAPAKPSARFFDVAVVGHLRPVKDPFRTALAARCLPRSSRIRVLHIGAALTDSMRRRAEREMLRNARYRWLGALPPGRTRRRMTACRLLAHTSRTEGGANVITEAIVDGLPVVSSRIPGSVGLLGDDYPGYFETGNTRQLADMLLRAETDPAQIAALRQCVTARQPLFTPERERAAWERLLGEVLPQRGAGGNV